jgi:hypothetical protein
MNYNDFICIRIAGKYFRINLSHIFYIRADKNQITIITDEREYKTFCSLKSIESILPPGQFCRVHRSYLVAVSAVTSFEYEKIYLGQRHLSLTDPYRKNFFKKMNIINPLNRDNKEEVVSTSHKNNKSAPKANRINNKRVQTTIKPIYP